MLYIYADEPAPTDYDAGEPLDHPTLALGLLLDASASIRVACTSLAADAVPSDESQALAFIRAIEEGEGAWHGDGRTWLWEKVA